MCEAQRENLMLQPSEVLIEDFSNELTDGVALFDANTNRELYVVYIEEKEVLEN